MEILDTNDVFATWGKDVKKINSVLLEDNQFVSLPVITVKDNSKCLTSVVFSISSEKNKVLLMQQYFWDGTKREMVLCEQEYKVEKSDFAVFINNDYKSIYIDKLKKIWTIAYNKNISSKEYALLVDYIDILNILGSIKIIYKKTNATFFEWFNRLRS